MLVQAAHPKRIIPFGSQARGDAASHSDFDIMVVEDKPPDRFAEMVRLNRRIRSCDVAIDLLRIWTRSHRLELFIVMTTTMARRR